MNGKYQYYLIIFSFILFISCNTKLTPEKQADIRLEHIKQLINDNSLNAAKIEIDSIHALFPRLVDKRRIAASLEDTIERRESARTLAYCDSILPIKQHEADSIEKNFRFEKNQKYEEIGKYVYKSQQTEFNANRIYLKAYVDENADFYLISNYCGAKINHTSVQVSVDDVFAQTDSIGNSNDANHNFSDGGNRWEIITYKNEANKGVAGFIAQYSANRIKVTLHGKKSYVYYLADSDKKAITEAYHLWVVKKDVAQLLKEIKKATIKIGLIKARSKL